MFIWCGGDGERYTSEEVINEINDYTRKGGKLYVGTDSMTHVSQSTFVCVVALHDNAMKIARYFYKKINLKGDEYKNLQTKIFKEVQYSVSIADFLRERYPEIDIEVHVDIGSAKKSATRKFISSVRGWVVGSGFCFKHKPYAWAASSVADWHTK
jgi:hypothetical protein